MSDEPTIESLQATITEQTAKLEDQSGQITSILAKNEELLGETKKAKAAARDTETKATQQAADKAKADGDFEQLYKSSQAANAVLQEEHDGLKGSVSTEKRNNAAMKVATELADGANADLLSSFIAPRLKFTDEGLKVTDASGNLTVSTLADLTTEFKNDARYSALLKGNQSNGGGANGGGNGGGAAKTISRADFNALNPVAQAAFAKDGTVTDQ